MRRIVILALSVVVPVTIWGVALSQPRPNHRLTADDYAIYSVCIRRLVSEHDAAAPLLVAGHVGAWAQPQPIGGFVRWEILAPLISFFRFDKGLSRGSAAEFSVSGVRRTLQRRLSLPYDYHLLTEIESRTLRVGEHTICPLGGRERCSPAVSLSPIAYSPDRRRARVDTGYICGSLCGHGWMMEIARTEGVWKVVGGDNFWVASSRFRHPSIGGEPTPAS